MVYPHVCGAAFVAIKYQRLHSGLSPRVWGSQNMSCAEVY